MNLVGSIVAPHPSVTDVADILLVHGAWQGPWCWDEFAGRLIDGGHEVIAVQLRGHDGRQGRIWHLLRDYLHDVEQAAARFTAPPTIVGHSIGGFVAQKYLERQAAPAAVLLASIPPGGTLGVTGRMLRRRPLAVLRVNATLNMRHFVDNGEMVRELFFGPETPQSIVDAFYARAQNESYPAYVDSMFVTRARPGRVKTPVLVLGARYDGIVTVDEVHRTAGRYGTEAEIYDMGHQMMLDIGWESVADRVAAWVAEHEPGLRPPTGDSVPR
jgi:alpha-beta hydrolase superfamily lysophospholipase